MKVSCACGQSFNAPEKLAGKTVKCPKCGGALAIPNTTAVNPQTSSSQPAASPLQVQCGSCGGQFKAPPKLAGKQIACPNCSNPLTVPAAAMPVQQPAPVNSPDALDPLASAPSNNVDDLFDAPIDPMSNHPISNDPLGPASQDPLGMSQAQAFQYQNPSAFAPTDPSAASEKPTNKKAMKLSEIWYTVFGYPPETHFDTLYCRVAFFGYILVLIFCSMEMVDGWGTMDLNWHPAMFYFIAFVAGIICGFFLGGPHWLPGLVATPIAGLGSLGTMAGVLAGANVVHSVILAIAGMIGAVPGFALFVLFRWFQDQWEGNDGNH